MNESQFFVKVTEFKSLLDLVSGIKSKVQDANASLKRTAELKEQEEKLLESWKEDLDEVQKKLEYIEGALFHQE